MATIKTLRDYQERLVAEVCDRDDDVLVEQPTGSGKTLAIVAIVGKLLRSGRLTQAVIAAPQEQIEHGFVHRDYQAIESEGGRIEAPAGMIFAARNGGKGSVRELVDHCRGGTPGRAVACTHASLNHLDPADLPDDLAGHALVVDEAHHAPAAGLARVVGEWRRRGGRLLFFTATPFRSDGREVRLEGMRLLRRSLSEHMQDGDGAYAPRHLDNEIVPIELAGLEVTGALFSGEAAPDGGHSDRLAEAIARTWERDGRPRAIVRVPPLAGGSGEVVGKLVGVLRARGARVLDATGTGKEDKGRFLAALERERTCGHAEAHDLIVGIQRVLEGTDWPHCSTVYCVGLPASLQTVVQLIGRAMRPKDASHPAAHRDRARIAFFVPTAGGGALAGLPLDHSRHALLVGCFLADSRVGQEWLVGREVRRGIGRALGGDPGRRAEEAEALAEADLPIPLDERARIQLILTQAYREAKARGKEPNVEDLTRAVADDPLTRDVETDHLVRIATEVLVQQEGVGPRVAAEIATRLERGIRAGGDQAAEGIRRLMADVFAEVLQEFRSATIVRCPSLEELDAQLHRLTGGQMERFAGRLREAGSRPITVEEVRREIRDHHTRTGGFPTQDSGFVGRFGCSYATLDHNLRRGNRGLPGGSSVAAEVEAVRMSLGLASKAKESLSLERVREAIRDEDPHVRCRVAPALGLVGGSSGEAELALEGALWDPDAEVRAAAARILIARGAGDRHVEALEAIGEIPLEVGGKDHRLLIAGVLDDRERVRRAAASALAHARMSPGRATGFDFTEATHGLRLEGLLESEDRTVLIAAALTLAFAGSSTELAVTALLTCLIDEWGGKGLAARAIAGVAASGALPPPIRKLLAGQARWDRPAAVGMLGRVGVPYGLALDPLVEAMDQGEPQESIVPAIAKTATASPEAAHFFLNLVLDDRTSQEEVEWAVEWLEEHSPGTESALEALIELWIMERLYYADACAHHFLRIEESFLSRITLGDWHIVKLTAMLANDSSEGEHSSAAERILRCTGSLPCGVLDELLGLFRDLASEEYKLAGLQALGAEAEGWAVPALLKLLWSDDRKTVLNAAAVLDRLDRPGAVRVLGDRLRDGTTYARSDYGDYVGEAPAAAALALLRAREAVPALVLAAGRGPGEKRIEAVLALGRILGEEVVPVLADLLIEGCSPGPHDAPMPDGVARAAAGVLGALGTAAREAAHALEGVLAKGPDDITRGAVEAALASIRGAAYGPHRPEAHSGEDRRGGGGT